MNNEDNAAAMDIGEEIRKELLNTNGNYELTYKVLLAYQPSLAQHIPKPISGKSGGLRAFSDDLQNAFAYLVPA